MLISNIDFLFHNQVSYTFNFIHKISLHTLVKIQTILLLQAIRCFATPAWGSFQFSEFPMFTWRSARRNNDAMRLAAGTIPGSRSARPRSRIASRPRCSTRRRCPTVPWPGTGPAQLSTSALHHRRWSEEVKISPTEQRDNGRWESWPRARAADESNRKTSTSRRERVSGECCWSEPEAGPKHGLVGRPGKQRSATERRQHTHEFQSSKWFRNRAASNMCSIKTLLTEKGICSIIVIKRVERFLAQSLLQVL